MLIDQSIIIRQLSDKILYLKNVKCSGEQKNIDVLELFS